MGLLLIFGALLFRTLIVEVFIYIHFYYLFNTLH